ncbi:hypothetical protein TRVL_02189 [Trypanosoma vivax]|nr:hypothetical protein TRVL_02189 [Trypanosoma vivax]
MRPPLFLSGRCFWGRLLHNRGQIQYTAVEWGNSDIPTSLLGNTYYERRFGRRSASAAVVREKEMANNSLPSLRPGDIVVRTTSSVPFSLRSRRLVDVTGICTSYFNASERNPRARCKVDDVIQSMHLYDGHEIPELNRGQVALGKLVVLCAFPRSGTMNASSLLGEKSLVLLENAALMLLNRSSLTYSSDAENVQLVRKIAEGCQIAAAGTLCLEPVLKDGNVVSVRLKRR